MSKQHGGSFWGNIFPKNRVLETCPFFYLMVSINPDLFRDYCVMDGLRFIDHVTRQELEQRLRREFSATVITSQSRGKTIDELKVGDCAEIEREITDLDVLLFAAISGDTQSIHLDAAYAAQTRFGKRIAHGILTVSCVSAVLGTKLPGLGTILLMNSNLFLGPVFIGDHIKTRVEVVHIDKDKKRVTLLGSCVNQENEQVLTSNVLVIPPSK